MNNQPLRNLVIIARACGLVILMVGTTVHGMPAPNWGTAGDFAASALDGSLEISPFTITGDIFTEKFPSFQGNDINPAAVLPGAAVTGGEKNVAAGEQIYLFSAEGSGVADDLISLLGSIGPLTATQTLGDLSSSQTITAQPERSALDSINGTTFFGHGNMNIHSSIVNRAPFVAGTGVLTLASSETVNPEGFTSAPPSPESSSLLLVGGGLLALGWIRWRLHRRG
jgi:hypothetical protein